MDQPDEWIEPQSSSTTALKLPLSPSLQQTSALLPCLIPADQLVGLFSDYITCLADEATKELSIASLEAGEAAVVINSSQQPTAKIQETTKLESTYEAACNFARALLSGLADRLVRPIFNCLSAEDHFNSGDIDRALIASTPAVTLFTKCIVAFGRLEKHFQRQVFISLTCTRKHPFFSWAPSLLCSLRRLIFKADKCLPSPSSTSQTVALKSNMSACSEFLGTDLNIALASLLELAGRLLIWADIAQKSESGIIPSGWCDMLDIWRYLLTADTVQLNRLLYNMYVVILCRWYQRSD
ncbi:unnamed protein product [Protopolystoma xenopodis]|uniref:Uncharacterized protein n=1 Tax=Protopolystoma xenopodis TaxID=117903 RepID=A0A3S5A2H7_9PLAT|nr:unnamed protein product [Protopolystoma xenopodis]